MIDLHVPYAVQSGLNTLSFNIKRARMSVQKTYVHLTETSRQALRD